MNLRRLASLLLASAAAAWGCQSSPRTGASTCSGDEKENSAGECVQCLQDSDCGSGKTCNSTGSCVASAGACTTDHDCTGPLATACCSGTCTNTQSDAAANCGKCGAPACAEGDQCCAGTCSDTTSDSANCGACGNSCGGGTCASGKCPMQGGMNQFSLYALADVSGNIGAPSGTPAAAEALKPIVNFTTAGLETTSFLISGSSCNGAHYDANGAPTAPADVGTITISGYPQNALTDGSMAPTEIQCVIQGGIYQCGYGALMSGVLGPDPAEDTYPSGTNALGSSSTITFAASGSGNTNGFNVTATSETSFPVTEDLSAVTYDPTASGGTTLQVSADCPNGSCSGGAILALVQATSNDNAHFDETSSSWGYIQCVQLYGMLSADGFSMNYGAPQVTISQAAIQAMLTSGASTDATLTTFATTVVTLQESDLMQLAAGGQQVAIATTGSFGVVVAASAQ